MNNIAKIVLFGIGVWLVPFVLGVVIFPLQESTPELFDSIMVVAVSVAAVGFGLLYLRRAKSDHRSAAIRAGIFWLLIVLVIDVPLFTLGFAMPLKEYVADIGVTYLIIPVTLCGLGVIGSYREGHG